MYQNEIKLYEKIHESVSSRFRIVSQWVMFSRFGNYCCKSHFLTLITKEISEYESNKIGITDS